MGMKKMGEARDPYIHNQQGIGSQVFRASFVKGGERALKKNKIKLVNGASVSVRSYHYTAFTFLWFHCCFLKQPPLLPCGPLCLIKLSFFIFLFYLTT